MIVLLDVLITAVLPKISKNIVDGLSQSLTQGLLTLCVILGVCWTLDKILHSLQEIVFFPVINVCIRDIQLQVISHLHQISFLDFQYQSIPEILSCIKRISQSTRSFLRITFLMLIPSILKVLVLSVLILKLGSYAAIVMATLGLSIVILYQGTRWYVAERESAWQVTDTVMMKISDSINNTKIVRPFLQAELFNLHNILNSEANLWQKSNFKLHIVPILIGFTFGLSFLMILAPALTAVTEGVLTVGEFIMLKAQFIALFLPFKSFSQECRQLAESLVDIKKIMTLLNLKLELLESSTQTNAQTQPQQQHPSQEPKLALQNVSFEYLPNQKVLDKVSIQIQTGDKIAIIGKNGSGKSSLMGILSGLLKPSGGCIQLNGQDIKAHSMQATHKIIHMIPQDFRIFNTSLRENLSYGSENITDDQMFEILHRIELNHLLTQLSHGLETPLGEFGIRLSGGEKQKLALGRALLLKPKILILDETLHALTIESEEKILKILFERIPTVLIASQRTSILHQVNRIFLMEGGKLIEIPGKQPSLKEFTRTLLSTEHVIS